MVDAAAGREAHRRSGAAMIAETTELRWFEEYGECRRCGKQAAGILLGVTNNSYGPHCKKCADKRLKDSARARVERE